MNAYLLWSSIFLGAYFIWLLILAIRSMKATKGELSEFFLADKDVGFIPSLLTFWATYFSAVALLGASGYYYLNGIGNFYFAAIGYCILAVVTGTVGRRLWGLSREFPEIRSPIQLYLQHFKSPALELLFVVVSLLCLVPYMAAQITGFGLLSQSAFGIPYIYTSAGALGIIYLYSESGGLKNIVQTDVVQSLMTIVGCVGVVVAFLWIYWSMDLAQFFADVDAVKEPSLLSIPGPNGIYSPLVVISLAILISVGAVPMAHNAQRYMIVREEKYLKRMIWMFPVMGVFVTITAAVLGLGGAVHFPGLENGDQVLGMVTTVVPPVIGSLAIVGIIAATMSTADSILLSVGFIISEQWYREKEGPSTRSILRLNRWCTLAIAIFAFIASIRPSLVTEFAFNAFGGMLQLAPVMVAGIYKVRIGLVTAFISVLSGLGFVVLGATSLYGQYLPEGMPPYFLGFLCAIGVVLIGRIIWPLQAES